MKRCLKTRREARNSARRLPKTNGLYDVPVFPQDKIQGAIDNLDKFISRPQFADIEAEYRSFNDRPEWYQLFGGPPKIQQLAYRLNHHVQYDFLYRQWSAVSHAKDFSEFIAVDSTGESGIRGIRDAGSLQEVSLFAATFMVEATRILIRNFDQRRILPRITIETSARCFAS